jgi:hypothetical protein
MFMCAPATAQVRLNLAILPRTCGPACPQQRDPRVMFGDSVIFERASRRQHALRDALGDKLRVFALRSGQCSNTREVYSYFSMIRDQRDVCVSPDLQDLRASPDQRDVCVSPDLRDLRASPDQRDVCVSPDLRDQRASPDLRASPDQRDVCVSSRSARSASFARSARRSARSASFARSARRVCFITICTRSTLLSVCTRTWT